MGVTRAVIQMQAQGVAPRAMRATIDRTYARLINQATPTPYPPA